MNRSRRNALPLSALFLSLLVGVAVCHAQEPTAGPKNVIIMISDGCGYNHIAATGMFLHGEPGTLSFEQFPVKVACSTFPLGGSYDPEKASTDMDYVKEGPTDSAAAATALATGAKTANGRLGVTADGAALWNLMEVATARGKTTGVVTSVPLSHATPAGYAAHQASRSSYSDIAAEMLLDSRLSVIMGCGHPDYDDGGKRVQPRAEDDEKRFGYVGGPELWRQIQKGVAGGDADGDGYRDPWTFIETREQFEALTSGEAPPRVIGVAQAASTLQEGRPATVDCNGDGKLDAEDVKVAAPMQIPLNTNVPDLATMTLGAINVLDADPDGFALMIEGGAVDWAGHSNLLGRVIEEQMDFTAAVDAVIDWVEANSNWEETVLIVTADHETGYLTGPGSDEKPQPLQNNGKGKLPGAQFHSGGHTNSLVGVYARGWGAEKLAARATGEDPVHGAYMDNTDIPRFVIETLSAK